MILVWMPRGSVSTSCGLCAYDSTADFHVCCQRRDTDRNMQEACTLWQCDLTTKTLSMQGLQKWWPQGVESGWLRTPLHSLQWNSLRARSCSVT